MGKSLGNVLDPEALLERCGSDALRWYLLREIPFGEDGDFQQQRFTDLVNNDLANTIGNLLNRTSSMARKWFGEAVPPAGSARQPDHPLAQAAQQASDQALAALEELNFRGAAEALLQLAIQANGYLNERAPWALKKQGDQDAAVAADLYAVLEACRWIGVLLTPLLPDLAARMQAQLDQPPLASSITLPGGWGHLLRWGLLEPGLALPTPQPVMQRLELDGPL